MRDIIKRIEWIADLAPENCPGGIPTDERGWRDLVNRMVKDVRRVIAEVEGEKVREPDRSDRSDRSDSSGKADRPGGLIPRHGGYRRLRSFQVASIIYDGTCIFCDRFISKRSRTHDQMIQAARSGRQNIAEGSMASATSKKTALKLTNVAKASLEELLLDYEDYLRHNKLRQWEKDDPQALVVRKRFNGYPAEWFEGEQQDPRDPYEILGASGEVSANTLLCLIHQAVYLIKKLIEFQEKAFLNEGGFTENLYRKRQQNRR